MMKTLIIKTIEEIEEKFFGVDNYKKFLRYNEFVYADPEEIKYLLNPNRDDKKDKAIDEALAYMSAQFHISGFKGIHDGAKYYDLPHSDHQIKNIHPSATNKEVIYKFYNGDILYEDDFEIGQEIVPGDGSFLTSDNNFDSYVDRFNENNPVLTVVSKPYWALVYFSHLDEKKKMYRFVDVISSKSGITYRVLAYDCDESIFDPNRPKHPIYDESDFYSPEDFLY